MHKNTSHRLKLVIIWQSEWVTLLEQPPTYTHTTSRSHEFTLPTDNGYIEGKELDDFFRHMLKRLSPQVSLFAYSSAQICSTVVNLHASGWVWWLAAQMLENTI